MKERIYLNLTMGLRAKNRYKNAKLIRIQSSHIESKAYDNLFYTLDDDLLYNLAVGNKCIIVDYSSNNVGKVIKIGVPIIKHILLILWFGYWMGIEKIGIRFLNRIYSSLSYKTKEKLRYYNKFVNTNTINLEGISIKLNKERL